MNATDTMQNMLHAREDRRAAARRAILRELDRKLGRKEAAGSAEARSAKPH